MNFAIILSFNHTIHDVGNVDNAACRTQNHHLVYEALYGFGGVWVLRLGHVRDTVITI